MSDQFNFLSPKFDALLALTTPGVQPPIPNARPLDNLHSFRRLLPSDHPQYLAPKTDIGGGKGEATVSCVLLYMLVSINRCLFLIKTLF